MNKQEFETIVKKLMDKKEGREHTVCITLENWDVINFVYTFHPAISNKTGKMDISFIYVYGGMSVIRGMLECASRANDLENKIAQLKTTIRYEESEHLRRIEELKQMHSDRIEDLNKKLAEASDEMESLGK